MDALPALSTLIVIDHPKSPPFPISLPPQIHSTQFFLLKIQIHPTIYFKLQGCLSKQSLDQVS